MSRRRGLLPTEHGYAPPFSPYFSFDQPQGTDSTGSQDSIMTQVPLPYHLSSDYIQSVDQNPYVSSAPVGEQQQQPWSSPMTMSNNVGFIQQPLNQHNPANTPGFSPQAPIVSANTQYQRFPGNNGNFGRGEQYQKVQGQQQSMPYLTPSPYKLPDNPAGVFANQVPYGISANPYDHFGAGASPYNPYSTAPEGYSAMGMSSPAGNYSVSSPSQGYQMPPYGPGTLNGIASSTYGNPQIARPYFGSNQSFNPLQSIAYSDNSRQYQSKKSSFNRGKINRNGNDKRSDAYKQANSSRHQQQESSNRAVATDAEENKKCQIENGECKVGASILALNLESEAHNFKEHSSPCTRHNSPERQLQQTEKVETAPAPEPAAKPGDLDLKFSSESRNAGNPHLRSRRHQSISTVSIDGVPKGPKDVNNWLKNTSTQHRAAEPGLLNIYQPPPKMMSLLTGSSVETKLTSLAEDDPFGAVAICSSAARNSTNPFKPIRGLASDRIQGVSFVHDNDGMSPQLRSLTDGGKSNPSIDVALDARNLPFVETCRAAKEDKWGVIKIKNIPYSVNRPEILAFLGRNARIVNEQEYEPIHIVMERVTSKTLDCYVEFVNFNEAINAIERFEINRTGGRGGRLGQRHVEIELSSQEQLMKDLFPKAKNVKWIGGRPEILPKDPSDKYNSGFQGFVSKEELVMLVKHVEAPQRSPFSKDCPQRPFECLISTLLKYPWYMVDHITIQDRILLHNATKELLALLVDRVQSEQDSVNLNPMLLKRAWRAAIKCHGFTPSMKDDIVCICNIEGHIAKELGVAPHASHWNYLWTIGPKEGAPTDLILWYIELIREITTKRQKQLTLAEQAAQGNNYEEQKLFGDLDKLIEYPRPLAEQTLADVALAEWTAIEAALRRALAPALE